MKTSELKNYIRENIISTLSEDTEAEIAKTKELTAAVKDLDAAKKEAGIEEANVGLADLQDIGYDDGEYAVSMHFNHDVIGINNEVDYKYYRRGFLQGVKDSTASYKLEEKEDNIGLADLQNMGYVDGEYAFDKHFDKSQLNNTPDIKAYTKGFVQAIIDSAGSLRLEEKEDKEPTDAELDAATKRLADKGALKNPRYTDGTSVKENEDKEPSKADLKKTKGLAKAKEELALLTREMKSLAKKYSKAEGKEKEKLVKTLKAKTKLKKELEAIIDK